MQRIVVDEMALIVKSTATCCVNLIAEYSRIVANDAVDSMPSVLSHQLVKLRGREFSDTNKEIFVSPHQECTNCKEAHEYPKTQVWRMALR
jgi:hypothetical protein